MITISTSYLVFTGLSEALHHYGQQEKSCPRMIYDPLPPITLVLLAEAHVAVPVPLRHAGVVDHEEVHLKCVSTCSLNLVMLCSYELNHLDTTPITRNSGWHSAL